MVKCHSVLLGPSKMAPLFSSFNILGRGKNQFFPLRESTNNGTDQVNTNHTVNRLEGLSSLPFSLYDCFFFFEQKTENFVASNKESVKDSEHKFLSHLG